MKPGGAATTKADIDRVLKLEAAVDHLRARIARAEREGSPDLAAVVELAALNAAMMRLHRVATNHGEIVVAETDDDHRNWTTHFNTLLEMASEALLQRRTDPS